VCKCVLPPGDNPISVNKYIIIIVAAPNDFLIFGKYCTFNNYNSHICKPKETLGQKYPGENEKRNNPLDGEITRTAGK
jgi:hypothetical protein